MVVRILDTGTKQARRTKRSAAGSLRSLQLQPRTLERYKHAVATFFDYLAEARMPLPSSPLETDEVLADYLEEAWAEGEPRALVGDTLSGLQHFIPSLKRGLNDSWRLFGTWSKTEMPSRARPLLPDQALAMAGFALEEADPAMAAGLLAGFNGFLRPVELMITAGQCTFDLDQGLCHVNLGFTKGGKRAGTEEHVVIDEAEGVLLLARCLAGRPPGDLLFPRGMAQFRKSFARLVVKVGASPAEIKPYSLRRGGATHHWKVLANLSRTTLRGRWRHQPTARIYIQDGMAMLQKHHLTAGQIQKIARGKSLLRRLL